MRDDAQLQKLELPVEEVALVVSQAFDARQPGPLIGSIEALLGYLEEHEVLAAGRLAQFTTAHLPAMNACLPEPWPIAMKRPRMRSYPNLEALWLLMGVAGLIQVTKKGKKRVIRPVHEVVETWRAMNGQCRYVVLLEAWLIRGRPQLLEGYAGFRADSPLDLWKLVVSWAGHQHWDSYPPKEIQRMTRALGLLSLFGFLTLGFGAPDEHGGRRITDVGVTGFGNALLNIFDTVFRIDTELLIGLPHLDEESLRPVLAAVFSKWDTELPENRQGITTGTYLLDVNVGRARRRFAFPAELSFEALAEAILESVSFDNDPLYAFSVPGYWQEPITLCHPWSEETPNASEVSLGDMCLEIGDCFDFRFDFGGEWHFTIEVAGMDTQKTETWKLLEVKGKAPIQYPDDNDDFDR